MQGIGVFEEVIRLSGRVGDDFAHWDRFFESHGGLDGLNEVDVTVEFEGEEVAHVLDVEDEQVRAVVRHGHCCQQFVIFEEFYQFY